MSDQSQFVAGSIEDILLAMAEGLADAQDRLNLLDPFDAYGRPRPQYHVPYLDFDLKVYAQTRSDCLLYTSPSPRDGLLSRMPSSA